MKYGPEITMEIANLLKHGSNRTDAVTLVGIHYDTFLEWMKKTEFSEAIKKAEAECKNRNIAIIQKAAITTWQAAAWWLERKHPTEFALRRDDQFTDREKEEIPQRMADRARELLSKLEGGKGQVSVNGNGLQH